MKHTLRLLSYNIHKGLSLGNRKLLLKNIRDALRELDPELVFLQEVIGEHRRHKARFSEWPETSPLEFLGEEVWPHSAYGKNAIYDVGHHGNALLSKYPIKHYSNLDISTNKVEQRGLLHAIIDLPKVTPDLHCYCLHLGLTGRGRKVQLERIARQINIEVPKDAPLIVAGDFNDWQLSASEILGEAANLREVFRESTGKYSATYPARLPLLSLDRIYYRGFRVVNARVLKEFPWKKLSDHAPLYAELVYE